MYALLEERLRRIGAAGGGGWLRNGLKGLEKESLRCLADGALAQSGHPPALGSALTHPWITTDYSEALIELITPPHVDTRDTLGFLDRVHRFVYAKIAPEMLWATSMPCAVGDEKQIPIARYGTSNIGTLKHVYRVGLDWRYGRRMQAIAGVHYNYSAPARLWDLLHEAEGAGTGRREYVAAAYFGLIRNFQRLGWLVPYLFGTSPAVCKSFLSGRTSRFQEFDPRTLYMPWATSLRMSDIGYRNKNQAALAVSYDSLDAYVASLEHAISTPYPEYEAIGVRGPEGWRQLNANVLQIENEFYSFMRPKQITRTGEKPSSALRERGVEYVEMRALDVNPFDPVGVDLESLYFMEAFMLFCGLLGSPSVAAHEARVLSYNDMTVALRGREPGLKLQVAGRWLLLTDWAHEICAHLEPICELLDTGIPERPYGTALAAQRDKIADPESLPSARVLATMRERGQAFSEFALGLSLHHAAWMRARPLDDATRAEFEALARRSLQEQRDIEASDRISFSEFLARYLAGELTPTES